ncbi:hypothetical protein BH10BAC1_BH10BAC1_14290 [soil metagenome]
MKKVLILAAALLFLGAFLTSCRHQACAGVTTQVEKAKVSEQAL